MGTRKLDVCPPAIVGMMQGGDFIEVTRDPLPKDTKLVDVVQNGNNYIYILESDEWNGDTDEFVMPTFISHSKQAYKLVEKSQEEKAIV